MSENKTVEDLRQEIVSLVKEGHKKIDEQLRTIEQKGAANEALGAEIKAANDRIGNLNEQIRLLRADIDRPEYGGGGGSEEKSIGEQFVESDEWKEFAKKGFRKGVHISVHLPGLFGRKGHFAPWQEVKTTITSTAVGSATSGILVPQRVRDYVPAVQRRFTMRDVIPSRPTQNNAVEFPKENVFTNSASPVVEGNAKAESALTFTIGTAAVRTVAHWIPATNQVLDDWQQLQRIINNKMLYGLKLKEETEILSGDNLGVHLNGLITQAGAYAGTYDVAGDTKIDRLRNGIAELEAADYECDFIVIPKASYWQILGIKDETGGANKGRYVVGDPIGSDQPRTLWGCALVPTNSMTASKFLCGNSQQAEIFDRMQATVSISTEHEEYFTKNLVAIRVEERLTLAVYLANNFLYGNLP